MRALTLKFLLLFSAQVMLWNYFNFTPYLFIVFLPAMNSRRNFRVEALIARPPLRPPGP